MFYCFGADIRDAFSPKVVCVGLSYGAVEGSDRLYPMVPESAIIQGDDGAAYVFAIESTDEYPETSYKAIQVEVDVQYWVDGMVYIQFPHANNVTNVVVQWDKSLADGVRVFVI